jgi:membrane protein implicated in regulation of membrane protease activity
MSAEYISIKQGKDHVSSLQINKNREIIVIGAIKHGKRLRVKKEDVSWLVHNLEKDSNQF